MFGLIEFKFHFQPPPSQVKSKSMKHFYLFLILCVFSCELLAQSYVSPGILKQLVEQDYTVPQAKVVNNLVADVNASDNYQSTNRRDQYLDSNVVARLYSAFNINKNFSVNSFVKSERSSQASETARRNTLANGGGDRAFEDQGVFFEELNLVYNAKKYAVVLGKFDLDFGTAWRWGRGIWSGDIANGYMQREKLGINGFYRAGNRQKIGEYVWGIATFTNDRKNLDNATITGRDSAHKYDGLPGDTRSPQSYNVSLDVNFDFSAREKLSYHFSYINLAVNGNASPVTINKIADQKGVALGMNYKYPVRENFDVDALIEYVSMKNSGGNSDITESYLSANMIGKIYEQWNVTLGYSALQNSRVVAYGFNQNLAEISLGYEFVKNAFFDKLLFQVGYKNQRNDYKTSLETQNVLGALMRYQKLF